MKIELLLTTIALAILLSLVAAPAGADTIYMKNGRIITSSAVRVEGDHVYVRLLGGEVRFPLSLVDRIVEDDAADQPPTVVPVPEPASDPNDPPGQGDPGAPGGPAGQDRPDALSDPAGQGDPAAGTVPEDPEPAPAETREYWQNRLAPLHGELASMDGELHNLRSRTGGDVAAQIRRLEAARGRVQSQVDTILREARRLGVPPGWLR